VFVRLLHLLLFLSPLYLFTISAASAQTSNVRVYTARDGLADDYITAIAFEPNGSAWVGASKGVTHISDDGWVSYTRAHGLGDSFITSIAVAPDGKIWFGTQSGGVSVLDPISKTITTYNLNNSEIPSNFVTALAVDPANRVWVGTLNHGIARYDGATGRWTQFEFPEREITALALDGENAPWVGTPNGVFHFDGTNWFQDKNVGDAEVKRIDAFGGEWYLTAKDGRYILQNDEWVANDGADEITKALNAANVQDSQVTAFGKDEQQRYWLGTPRGIFMVHHGNAPNPPTPYPVVLVHGWTVAGDDTLETSEFRFLKSYADRDGIPLYYARGVSPENTLYQNAAVIRDEIARVKKETGAEKVNLIGFSMGGMNTRAYLETSLYANDVHRAIILGTPQAGVDIWKPILFQQILQKPNEPSAIELTPEYAQQVVNQTRAPNPDVAYDLLIGDARQQAGLDFLNDMPASDALISVRSALALDAPNVRQHVNADLHDWNPEPLPLDLTSYLYPRETWERYLRNALRNNDNAPIGSEILSSPDERGVGDEEWTGNHTPVITEKIRAGETVTRTVLVDENKSARFIAYYPNGRVKVSLVAPDGTNFEPQDLPREQDGVLSLSTDIASFSGYVVKDAQPGEWQMILSRTDGGGGTIDASTYAELDSPLKLNAFARFPTLQIGATNIITGVVTISSGEAEREVTMTARIALPATNVGEPYTFSELELLDDGKHNDGAANDGFFANEFSPARGGWYPVMVQARGSNFARESEFLFAAHPGGAEIIDVEPRPPIEPNTQAHVESVNVKVERAGDYLLSVKTNYADQTSFARVFSFSLPPGAVALSVAIDSDFYAAGEPRSFEYRLLDARWAALPLSTYLVPMDSHTP